MAEIGRDWDAELVQERTFKIGGELFEWIYPHWEIGAKIFDGDLTKAENGDGKQIGFWMNDTQTAISIIPLFLNPKNESHKRFKALVARKTDAVPRYQFSQLAAWLVEVTGGLPTNPSSSEESDDGAGNAEGSSSAESSSTEATSSA